MASWDIMFSYNWTSGGSYADRLEPILKKAGYTIWRDQSEMGKNDNMNKSMAEAVNGSKIILFFISKKYEESAACFKEYNYADSRQKIIIPLKVEKGYSPAPGEALDLLIANKMYYTLYENNFDENVERLLADIAVKLGKNGEAPDLTQIETKEQTKAPVVKQNETKEENPGPMGKHEAIQVNKVNLLMYLVNKDFSSERPRGQKFCRTLLEEEEGMADKIFADTQKSHYPVLESICYLKYDLGYDDDNDVIKMVTDALRNSDNAGSIDVYEEKKLEKIMDSLDTEHKLVQFSNSKERNGVYKWLSERLNDDARLFAHFLLPYHEVANIFLDDLDVKKRLEKTFNAWDRKTEDRLRTWTSIRNILTVLNKRGPIKTIEKVFAQQK